MRQKPSSNFLNYLLMTLLVMVMVTPLVGFVAGLVLCNPCTQSILERIAMGVGMALATILSAGLPPRNDDLTDFYNLWPYIILTSVVLMFFYWWLKKTIDKRLSL